MRRLSPRPLCVVSRAEDSLCLSNVNYIPQEANWSRHPNQYFPEKAQASTEPVSSVVTMLVAHNVSNGTALLWTLNTLVTGFVVMEWSLFVESRCRIAQNTCINISDDNSVLSLSSNHCSSLFKDGHCLLCTSSFTF